MRTSGYQFGWETLAEYSGCSRRTLFREKKQLIEAKVIDYKLKGFPPRKVMRWHPDRYDAFIDKKIKEGIYEKRKRN